MTKTIELINTVARAEVLKHNLACRNVKYFFGYGSATESDVLSLNKNNYVTEFEIKVSRPDFLAEKKKERWRYFDLKLKYYFPNKFYYVCPAGMIKPEEIRSDFGLIYFDDNKLNIIQKPKFLHKDEWNRAQVLEKFLRISVEREYLGCCRLTLKNREIRERIESGI